MKVSLHVFPSSNLIFNSRCRSRNTLLIEKWEWILKRQFIKLLLRIILILLYLTIVSYNCIIKLQQAIVSSKEMTWWNVIVNDIWLDIMCLTNIFDKVYLIKWIWWEYLIRDVLFEFHLKFWNYTSIGILVRSLVYYKVRQSFNWSTCSTERNNCSMVFQ